MVERVRVVEEERVKRVVTGDKGGGEGEGDGGKGCRGSKGGEGGKNGLSGQVCQKNSKREKMNTLHRGWVGNLRVFTQKQVSIW